MANAPHLSKLCRYTRWANGLMYDALGRLTPETLAQGRSGRPAGMMGVLGHMWVISMIWKAHLKGEHHGFRTRTLDLDLSLSELQSRQIDVDCWYVQFADDQSEASAATEIDFAFVGGGAGRMRIDDILMHVANHGTYHRGYLADQLYESGQAPPTMDLPVYLRDAHANRGPRIA